MAREGDNQMIRIRSESVSSWRYREVSRHEVGLLGGIILIPAKENGAE